MRRSLLVFTLVLLGITSLAICRTEATAGVQSGLASSLPPTHDLIARGKYLATAADCASCHTGPGRALFSGGLMMQTPFGLISSPNITPDQGTGIGDWTNEQFYRALHEGISPGHSWGIFPHYLYPAMPYTFYTKLSYEDSTAIKAYLDSLPPIYAPRADNQLVFPFNQRPVMFVWRLLFFTSGPMAMDATWSAGIKRGAYLSVALGHCGACHTPRNFMQASIASKALSGAPIEGLFAPNISSDPRYGVGGWNKQDLIDYLHTGSSPPAGSAYGPMRMVIENSTSHLSLTDLEDMADYLQQATPPQATPAAPPIADADLSIARGKQFYESNCSACHSETGTGMPPLIPNLASNGSVTATLPDNVISAMLNGLTNRNRPGLAMPAFRERLSNQQIADISNYVRTAWGNKGMADASALLVQKLRRKGVRAIPMMMGRASCPGEESGQPDKGD